MHVHNNFFAETDAYLSACGLSDFVGKKGGSCINYGVNLNAFGSEVRENIEMKGYQKFVTLFQRSSDCGWMKGCRKQEEKNREEEEKEREKQWQKREEKK